MWLKASRTFIFIVAILAHGVLGTLAVGNLIFGGLTGWDLSVNAYVCLLGLPTSLFLMIIAIAEHSQGDQTTTTLLFEFLWVTVLWAADAVAGSLVSKGPPLKCLQTRHINWKWDLCVAHMLLVPLAWISVALLTMHIIILTVLVQWHRARAPRMEQAGSSRGIKAWFSGLFRDEAFVMGPLIDKSVYSLLKTRASAKRGHQSARQRRFTIAFNPQADMDVEKSMYSSEKGGYYASSGSKRGSHGDFVLSPYSEAPPAYLSPPPMGRLARYDSNQSAPDSLLSPIIAMYDENGRPSKVQLHDEPHFEILTVPPPVLSPNRTIYSPSYPEGLEPSSSKLPPSPQLVPYSPLPPTPMSSSSQIPSRSRTLPTRGKVDSPRSAHFLDIDPAVEYSTPLARHKTVASTRRFIPSRYANIDLVASGYIDRLSKRFSTASASFRRSQAFPSRS